MTKTHQLNRSAFLSALTTAMGCVSPKSTLPVLSCILVNESYICATDLVKSISVPLLNLITPEPFATCIPAKPLHDWLSATSPAGQLTITVENTRAKFTCGSSKASFPTIVADEFPAFPKPAEESITFPGGDLLSIINRGTSARDCEYFLLQLSPPLVAAAQTACISECRLASETPPWSSSAVLPSDTLAVLRSFLGAPMDVAVSLSGFDGVASSKLHLSRSDGATLHLSLLEQKFPQYNVIFEGDFNLHYTISLSDIKAALKTLRPFTSELPMITLVADPSTDELKITTRESSELGSGESTISLLSKNFTVPFTNSLSINYLTSVLDAVKTPNVLVKSRPLGDLSESPYVITQIMDDEQDSLFRSIIAPMYLA